MIRFALRCENGHGFDSWFRDNQAYDELVRDGHLACPDCGSAKVSKALMAPAVVTGRRRKPQPTEALTPSPVDAKGEEAKPQPVAILDERATALRTALRELRDQLVSHSKDVGTEFAAEARRIHDGQSESGAIHGQASREEVRSLVEDGIEIMPLPVFPDEHN